MSATSKLPTRLLVVDDDPAQLRLWERLLYRGLGDHVEITAMADPHAALAHAQRHGVEILITDLSMPGVDGIDLVRCVKSRNPLAQTLLITGTSTTESLLASVELGAVDYLLKPVKPEVLVEVAQQADARLRRWRMALAGAFSRKHSLLDASS